MNKFYRALIALSAVLPLSIPFAFLFSDEWSNDLRTLLPSVLFKVFAPEVLWILFIVVFNVAIGFSMVEFLKYLGNNFLTQSPIKVQSIKLLGGDSMMGYLPYVLPLFITQSNMQPVLGWIVGALVLFVLAYQSSTIPYSPLLKVCGLKFFEATLADGRTVILLVHRGIKKNPLRLAIGADVSKFCIFGVE